MQNNDVCYQCGEAVHEHYDDAGIDGDFVDFPTMVEIPSIGNPNGRVRRVPTHIACLDNSKRPQEFRVCDTCHKTGQDESGDYPSNYVYARIQHHDCVDGDDYRKYKGVDD